MGLNRWQVFLMLIKAKSYIWNKIVCLYGQTLRHIYPIRIKRNISYWNRLKPKIKYKGWQR